MTEEEKERSDQINTGGGAAVGDNVNTHGGDFIGRDQIVHGDVAKAGGTIYQGNHIEISGRGHSIAGDVVGGNQIKIVADSVATDHSVPPGLPVDRLHLIAELQKLCHQVEEVVNSGALEQEDALLVCAQIDAALIQARKSDPSFARIARHLTHAQGIVRSCAIFPENVDGLLTNIAGLMERISSTLSSLPYLNVKETNHA